MTHDPPARSARPPDGPILPGAAADTRAEAARHGLPFAAVVVVGFIGVGACMVVLGTIAESIRNQEALALDTVATPLLHGLASPQLDLVMQTATFIGSTGAVVPLTAAVAVLLLTRRRRRDAFFLVVAVIGSILLNAAMKVFFQRPRPQLPWAHVLPDYSFPSGHTMTSLVLFLAVALLIWQARGRALGSVAVALAVLGAMVVGMSRIYLGYHYLTDVVGGLLAGFLWLVAVLAAFRAGQQFLGPRVALPATRSTP